VPESAINRQRPSLPCQTVLSTLTNDDVLYIHQCVCEDFSKGDDPVGFGGTRDDGALLDSAVYRQHIGFEGKLKFGGTYENAATLAFGLCCNHPFNNGNKRTALVAMLAHLERNHHSVFGINQGDLYGMIKDVATHTLGIGRVPPRRKNREYTRREADEEVQAIAEWLKPRARKIHRGEQQITYRQLGQILAKHGFKLANPKSNYIGIYKKVKRRKGPLRKQKTEWIRIEKIGYPSGGRLVGMNQIKHIRRVCALDEPHGCDTESFYEGADKIEPFINAYWTVLTRLSKE
jgi:death-on-curing family protein